MMEQDEQDRAAIVARYLTARRSTSPLDLRAFVAEHGPFSPSILRSLAVAEMESRWESGDARPVEWVLAQVPALRADSQAVLELIGVELRWMRSQPDLAAYVERFPELAAELERLFDLVELGTKGGGLPTELGRYQIRRMIGRGGFGEVFAAWDPQLERNVAVKCLRHGDRRSGDSDRSAPGSELLAEARRVALLDHRAIVPVYDVGEQDGALFIVSRLIDGDSMDRRLRAAWPWRRAAKAVARVADALAYAHARGVIHRDIKPANILVDSDGLVFLTDFGLSAFSHALGDRPARIVGTLPYLAPELLDGNAAASEATDIFSLGVVLYQLLTGRLPWNSREIGALKRLHAGGEATLPNATELNCPPAILAACERALRRDPSRRHSSAAEFARELRRAARGGKEADGDAEPESLSPQLPANLTSIVGRDQELDWLRDNVLQRQRRLLTVTGMGGVGKSRLALELGWDLVDELANRVYFVELAALQQASLVLPRILQSLELPEAACQSPLAALADFFGTQRSLLLLDNFEQVLSAGPQLTALLERCPGLRIVVTSRIPLGIRGEQVMRLAPLPQPPGEADEGPGSAVRPTIPDDSASCASVELFVQRARQTLPEFQVDATNLKTVWNLCRRLDGLPLAIELAAVRLASFSLEELESRLTRRRLLTQPGPSDLPDRQRTLWNTIQWSVDLLSPVAREVFDALCLFGAGATREAIEAIFDDRSDPSVNPDWETACDEIIASNLVRIDRTKSNSRWSMLETVREFARIEFEKRPDRVRRLEAFGAYYMRLAETAARRHESAAQVQWLCSLDSEYGNLRATLQEAIAGQLSAETGLRVAAALWWYWETRGMLEEGLFWLRSLITPDLEVSPATLGAACNAYGNLARKRGRIDEAEGYYRRALTLRESACDQRGVGATLQNLGNIALERGDWTKAAELYVQSLEIRRSIGDDWGVAMALSNLALTAINLSLFSEAEKRIAESLVLFERCGDIRNQARVIDIRGELNQAIGQFVDAISLHEKAWNLRETIGDRMGVGLSRGNLARAHFKARAWCEAQDHLLASLEIWRQIGADGQVPDTLELAAELACSRRLYAESAQLLAAAQELKGGGTLLASHACLDEIRRHLPADHADRVAAVGRAMSIGDACEFARVVLTRASEAST